MIQIAPSILAADFANLGRDVQSLSTWGADWLHFDVMDGQFVPNISFGPPILSAIRPQTRLPIDVHLMVENPSRFIPWFIHAGADIITFHEAFAYFADAYGLHVAGVIANEPGEEPSTRDIADTCDLVTTLGIRTLFVEPQYPQKAAETIARETGASIYTLDPCVSGDGTKESYETIMRENARVLTEALSK